jgi:hypothetical protein
MPKILGVEARGRKKVYHFSFLCKLLIPIR